MAANASNGEVKLAPADRPPAAEYWSDFYSWLMEQAAHVRAGRWEALDRENLAEEIESLGREQLNKLESALRVLMIHMLKWDHQPSLRSRSWVLSIEAQRVELEDVLSDNPGLKARISAATARAYRRARIEAANETGLEKSEFPEECPYTWNGFVAREFTR
ncbi:MAG TPA: DUF29 domain-containing protein [Xanthobacteraceae bacterium]|jgi:hypothetical protein